jgi:DNA-binding MarR family transcriptional regulator
VIIGPQLNLDDKWRTATTVDVPQQLARDPRLSFKARGIALYILSTGSSSGDEIAEANHCGRGQVQAGLRELERYGYLTRQQIRHRGAVTGVTYMIHGNPAVAT